MNKRKLVELPDGQLVEMPDEATARRARRVINGHTRVGRRKFIYLVMFHDYDDVRVIAAYLDHRRAFPHARRLNRAEDTGCYSVSSFAIGDS